MTTTPEAAALAEECASLAKKMMRESWSTGEDSAWLPTFAELKTKLGRLAALAQQPAKEVPAVDAEELKRALMAIKPVASLDGHDVIRRSSVIGIMMQRSKLWEPTPGHPGFYQKRPTSPAAAPAPQAEQEAPAESEIDRARELSGLPATITMQDGAVYDIRPGIYRLVSHLFRASPAAAPAPQIEQPREVVAYRAMRTGALYDAKHAESLWPDKEDREGERNQLRPLVYAHSGEKAAPAAPVGDGGEA